MADPEVENTLREIRERVRAEALEAQRRTAAAARTDRSDTSLARAGETTDAASSFASALARMEANLATTERAWNRLPPVVSYRSGWPARLELWLKRQIKRATHWFTWEQVNFNAAAHHALRDALAALAAYGQQLSDINAALERSKAELELQRAELLAELKAQRGEPRRD
jgi:hypothetical protein